MISKKFSLPNRPPLQQHRPPGDIMTHFSYSDVYNFVRGHGVACKVHQAILCPCVEKSTGQPRINCHVCFGTGFYYTEEIKPFEKSQCVDHRMIINNRAWNKDFQKPGGYTQKGSASATAYTFTPSTGDKIQPLKDIEVINDEMHQKGAKFQNGSSSEYLLMEDIIKVESIFTVNAAFDQVTKFLPEINFTMNGREIMWLLGQPQPALNERYTVRYQAIPEYIIMGAQAQFFVEHDEDEPFQVREEIDKLILWEIDLIRVNEMIKLKHGQ